MSYSESEWELDSNFAINSASDFDSDSESDSESGSYSAFMNLVIFVFLFCIYILPKNPVYSSFFPSS